MFFGDGAHVVEFFVSGFDPTGGPKSAMVLRAELVARFDIVVKKAAVIDDPRDEVDFMLGCGGLKKKPCTSLQPSKAKRSS